MISGTGDTVDRIVGLEVGVDDDIAKPFDPRELKARLKSVLRRYQRSSETSPTTAQDTLPADPGTRRVPVGNCVLDLDGHQLFDRGGTEIQLTRMEFDLLEVLVQRLRRPLSRDQLLNLTQNRDWAPYDRSVDFRIARLRRKIEADLENPQCIRTLRAPTCTCRPRSELPQDIQDGLSRCRWRRFCIRIVSIAASLYQSTCVSRQTDRLLTGKSAHHRPPTTQPQNPHVQHRSRLIHPRCRAVSSHPPCPAVRGPGSGHIKTKAYK